MLLLNLEKGDYNFSCCSFSFIVGFWAGLEREHRKQQQLRIPSHWKVVQVRGEGMNQRQGSSRGISKITKPGWGKREKTTPAMQIRRDMQEKNTYWDLESTGIHKNHIIGLGTPSNALGRRNLFRYGFRNPTKDLLWHVGTLHWFPAQSWLWGATCCTRLLCPSSFDSAKDPGKAVCLMLVLWSEHCNQNIWVVFIGHSRVVQLASCFYSHKTT